MSWDPSDADLLLEKPNAINILEKLSPAFLDSMPGVEVEEKIRDAAEALAKTYQRKTKDGNYEMCVMLVAGALTQSGSDIGGSVGTLMIGTAESKAKAACRLFYPESDEANRMEY